MTKETMKDSGIEWIGKIPQDWSVQKLKYVTRFGYGESLSDEKRIEGDVKVYGSNGVVGTNQTAITKGKTIIVGRKGSYGKIQLSSAPCFPIDTTFYIDKTQTHHELRWLYYVLQTLNLDTGSQDSTVPGLSREHAYNQIVTVPMGDEEGRIASFLDSKTSTIDHAIEQKRKLINLLKEKRTTIINRAVTRGLDEDVELVDSDVEWIGRVPKGWKMRKIAQSFNLIGSGSTPASGNEAFYEDGEINWIITGDLNDGTIYEASKKITKEAFASSSALKMYPRGTLLIAMYGATIGKVALIDIPACTNQACCALGESPYFENKFVYYWFLNNRKNIVDIYSYGSGQPNISQDTIKRLHIPAPSRDEQKKVIAFLDSKMDAIDQLISKVEHSIELLSEYRTSLISHVVTGKVEV